MIQMREYRDGDIDAIKNPLESTILDSHVREASNVGLFVTLEDDGVPVATGGLVMTDEDTAEAWAKIDTSLTAEFGIKGHIRLVRAFSDALDMVADCLGFPLVYSVVKDGFVKGERLARCLGFERIDDKIEKNGTIYNYYKRAS